MSRLVNAANLDVAVRRELVAVNRRIVPYYGSFYDTTNQTNPVANTVNIMRLNTTAFTNDISIQNDGSGNPTRIVFNHAGVYDVQFSAQVVKTDSNQDSLDIWLRQNGTDVPWSTTTVTLSGNNARGVAAWDWMVQAAAGDFVQIAWCSADTDVLLEADQGSGLVWDDGTGAVGGVWGEKWSFVQSPARPAIPSLIVTVLPVAAL
jgi:hypothetical protein